MRSIIRSIRRTPLPTIYRRQHVNFNPSQSLTALSARRFASSALLRQKTLQFDAMKDVERRLQMTFTCTAEDCGHRSTHEFTAQAYNTGIVLLTCPSCKNRHLIADHIGWFKESTEDGKLKTVEDLLNARGEQITRGRLFSDGDIEYYPSEPDEPPKGS